MPSSRTFVRALSLTGALFIALGPLGPFAPRTVTAGSLPDGRRLTPVGFTVPVEGFASGEALSPDGELLAVLSQDGGAVDVIGTRDSILVDRLALPSATGLTWTTDGLYVSRGYTGIISRFAYTAGAHKTPGTLVKRDDLNLGTWLLNGIAEDPSTHRIAVARTAAQEVLVIDDASGNVLWRASTPNQPFDVSFAGTSVVASLYDGSAIAVWGPDGGTPRIVPTGGPHPTKLLVAGDRVYVGNADGHDVVAFDATTFSEIRRYDLALAPSAPPGQTPSGMAISTDGGTLFVTESGFNDVAVVDVASGRIEARIPTGWYPMAVAYVEKRIGDKDTRTKRQLWIVSAQGLGAQPDPGGEWNGTYTGIVQHLVVEPNLFASWSARTAADDGFAKETPVRSALPAIRHVVFIVQENKHFDEEFGDDPNADGDPALVVYGRHFTPNVHALADRFTLFDNFMGNGEASIYGHAWTTQGIANDYQERNAHSRDESSTSVDVRVPWSIWPYPEAGEDTIPQADMNFDWFQDLDVLENGPRMNVSGVFGPRGELVNELARKGVSFRVYGEQLTMLPSGRIDPDLVPHAARAYPGAHIDFDVLDTVRAKIFLDDVAAHGLAQYSYLTLPTDHTAGTKPGFYTPASYVASNDFALGEIVAALSKRSDWRNTVVFVTTDDAQGTGDHVDDHRMPAVMLGPYVRRDYVDHTHYSIPSFLRTVEVLYGVDPLNIYDAEASPMIDAFARQPLVASYAALPPNVPMERNPGSATSFVMPIDGPDDDEIVAQEWSSIRGPRAVARAEAAPSDGDP